MKVGPKNHPQDKGCTMRLYMACMIKSVDPEKVGDNTESRKGQAFQKDIKNITFRSASSGLIHFTREKSKRREAENSILSRQKQTKDARQVQKGLIL
jgi:hypothetical protein